MRNFIKKTKNLINALTVLEEIYRNEVVVERSRSYFYEIKPEVDKYFDLIDTWGELAHQLFGEGMLAVYPQQIDATVDNMRVLIMHSYYKDVRKRRYMEIRQSCYYVFTQSIDGEA